MLYVSPGAYFELTRVIKPTVTEHIVILSSKEKFVAQTVEPVLYEPWLTKKYKCNFQGI